jgi:hypothetical protein
MKITFKTFETMATIETRINKKTNEFFEVTVKPHINTRQKREKLIKANLDKLFKAGTVKDLTLFDETSYNLEGFENSMYWHYSFNLMNSLSMLPRQSLTLDNKGQIALNLHPIYV